MKEINSIQHKNRKIKGIAFILVVLMAIVALVLYVRLGSSNLSKKAAIFVAINICGLVLNAALFAITTKDHREITKKDGYFFTTLMLLSFSLFFSELSWFVDGRADKDVYIHITNSLMCMASIATITCFYKYLLNNVWEDKIDKLKPLTIIIIAVEYIVFALAIINPVTGLLFYVDENHIAQSGPLGLIILVEWSHPLWLVAIVWVFISVYDKNRRVLESKQRDIDVADSVLKGIIPEDDAAGELTPEMKALADAHTIPDAMELTEMLTKQRVHNM